MNDFKKEVIEMETEDYHEQERRCDWLPQQQRRVPWTYRNLQQGTTPNRHYNKNKNKNKNNKTRKKQ
jgi:hypothetical protein